MDPTFLLQHWLAALVMLAGIGLLVATVVHRVNSLEWSWRLYLPALVLTSLAVGAFDFLPFWTSASFAFGAFAILVFLLILVIITSNIFIKLFKVRF